MAICKSRNGKLGNGMNGMMGIRELKLKLTNFTLKLKDPTLKCLYTRLFWQNKFLKKIEFHFKFQSYNVKTFHLGIFWHKMKRKIRRSKLWCLHSVFISRILILPTLDNFPDKLQSYNVKTLGALISEVCTLYLYLEHLEFISFCLLLPISPKV